MSFSYPNRREAMKLKVTVLTRGRNEDVVGAERKLSQILDDRGRSGFGQRCSRSEKIWCFTSETN